MRERGQSTVEYAGICLLVALLLLAASQLAEARLRRPAGGDARWLAIAQRYAPVFVAERGDGEQPVDFRGCRLPACAKGGRPVLYVHAVQRPGAVYLEYWEYLPDSRTAHTGIPAFDGYHRDDWEGLIVKLRPDGTVVGARASAHLGWAGRHPWWDLAHDDWAPYPAPAFRASGSHAGSFQRRGVDVAGDAWDGDAPGAGPPLLLPADAARRGAPAFDPGATAPWRKQVWSDPEAVTTGPPGSSGRYARYARWWAELCPFC
ncbi:MAG TPA: hypothetical protein VFH74_05135 [Gaiellales bacterium]|nr:hypothetical protein [Gaiellales bacterium]